MAAAEAAAAASTFAVEGIVKSRKRKGSDAEYLVDWEGYGEDDRSWEPEAAFADGGDDVLSESRKRRRKEGKQKQKQKQGLDNGGAAASAEESAVQVGEEPADDAAMPQKQKVKTCRVLGCISNAVARGVCRTHASAKRIYKLCCMPGCKTPSYKDLLCKKHGAYGVCKAPTCLTMALNASGLCSKHGANGFCTVDGCATPAQSSSKGLCAKHGGGSNQPCCMPGCKSLAKKDLLCTKHGAYGVCKAPTCLTMAANNTGLCHMHGANGFCTVDGCATPAQSSSKGLCAKHGGGSNQPCCMPGCKSLAKKDLLCTKHGAYGVCKAPTCLTMAANNTGLCHMHGANGFCSVDGCAIAARSKGLCSTHGDGNQQPCCMPGCKSLAKKDLLCTKHGAYGVCKAPTCLTMAANNTGLCHMHGANGFCSVEGCATPAQSKGLLCQKHGGGSTRTVCGWETGCTTFAAARGRCRKHFAYGMCAHEECTTSARSVEGYCGKHGGSKPKECSVPGCSTNAYARGVCRKHREIPT